MRLKPLEVVFVLICCCVIGLIVWFSWDPSYSTKGLLGLSGIEASDVESIDFIKNRETQQVWHTSDSKLIATVLGQYDNMSLSQERGGSVGAYLWFRLHLKTSINGESDIVVTLYNPMLYAGRVSSDGTLRSYRVMSGGFSEAEWEAILEACERVR